MSLPPFCEGQLIDESMNGVHTISTGFHTPGRTSPAGPLPPPAASAWRRRSTTGPWTRTRTPRTPGQARATPASIPVGLRGGGRKQDKKVVGCSPHVIRDACVLMRCTRRSVETLRVLHTHDQGDCCFALPGAMRLPAQSNEGAAPVTGGPGKTRTPCAGYATTFWFGGVSNTHHAQLLCHYKETIST